MAALAILVVGSALLGISANPTSVHVQMLSRADIANSLDPPLFPAPQWRAVKIPNAFPTISCSDTAAESPSLPPPITQQETLVGPGGTVFMEQVVATSTPQSLYDSATRPFNRCSKAKSADYGGHTVMVSPFSGDRLVSLYSIDGTKSNAAGNVGFVRLSNAVVAVAVVIPAGRTARREGGYLSLTVEAINTADPSDGLPFENG